MSKIEKLKDILRKALFEVQEEKLADNSAKEYADTEVKISEKAVGGKVETVAADGSLAPMPDGDFKVSGDDNVYSVKDGLITAVNGEAPAQEDKPAEQVKAAEADEPNEPAPGTPEDETEDDQEFEQLKAQVDALTQAVADMQAAMQNMTAQSQNDVAEFSKQVENLNDTIVKLAKIPAEVSKTNDSTVVKDENKNSQKALKELFKMKK